MTGTTSDSNERGAQRTIERTWDESTPPSTALVRAVADERGVDATRLRPLYDVVDADALDALVTDRDVTMSIEYEGFVATIRGDGSLELAAIEEDA